MAIGPTGPGIPPPVDPMADPNAPVDNAAGLMQMLAADQQQTGDKKDIIDRDPPDPPEQRARLVRAWSSRVKAAKKHWKPAFDRMQEDMDFAFGKQWSKNPDDGRYKANLTLRMVAQKTAFLYAKNPKAVARRRERLDATSWNETQSQITSLMQAGAMFAQQSAQPGAPPGMPPMAAASGPAGLAGNMMGNPMAAQVAQQGMAIMADAAKVRSEHEMLDKLGKTLELLYKYNIDEQTHPFKMMMKLTVRRTVTMGVSYVKLGFERVMQQRPDMEKGIADASERLATLERLSADHADDQFDDNDKESEQLRLLIEDLSKQAEFVAREGLTYDYPMPTNIIPDVKCVELRHFLGADYVAEQFLLTPHEVQEIYGKDVGKSYTAYHRDDVYGSDPWTLTAENWNTGSSTDDKECDFCCVWQIYCRKDGLVYEVCDGYEDFLREPASPEIYNERFYPWYTLLFNEAPNEKEIFPPSDVRLMMDMQREYNRCREGLKEQRIAARPFTAVVAGAIEEDDLNKLAEREANAIIELNALQPNQDVKQLLQAYAGPGIDNNLYEVNPVYEDVLRVTGVQEANLGGTSDATATQANIAEGSRMTSMGSNIDDLNDLMTQMARNGGQILLTEVSRPTVEKIVGVGCVWPEMSRQDIAQEVLLEVEAGSMGRPNAAQEVATAQRVYPLLIQLPGIDPEFLAKDLLRRMDDRLDLTQAFKSQLPSIVAMNGMSQAQLPGTGPVAGAAQGPQGKDNAAGPAAQPPGGPPDAAQQLGGAGVSPPHPSGAPGSPTLQ
jgi:hypothetical protein